MRKKFETQYSLGQLKIEDTIISTKCRDAFPKLLRALKELFCNEEYNTKLFNILEEKIVKGKKATGRKGMDLWQLFVMAQARLSLNIGYDRVQDLANNHSRFRQILGIGTESGFERKEYEYQNIVDNINLLDEVTLLKINDLIVEMGHDVFKKKETAALVLKTDSFVVESNVHFPTDYNLLWDSARKSIDCIEKICQKYPQISGWRNLHYWYKELKNQMRSISQSSKKSEATRKELSENYLKKAKLFSVKVKESYPGFPMEDASDLANLILLEYYIQMLDKHIDLHERRVLQDEVIAHEEKVFSIFEDYTQWICKGKQNPAVELGKNVQVTSDQYHLIVDFRIYEEEVDKTSVIELADRVLNKYKISGWSFDKGFYSKANKELLSLFINQLIMPKKGKLNEKEKEEETSKGFKRMRFRHSAIESNINELEYRGLDRCPDRGYAHFKRYVALGICAYNLHKIGAELLRQERSEKTHRQAA